MCLCVSSFVECVKKDDLVHYNGFFPLVQQIKLCPVCLMLPVFVCPQYEASLMLTYKQFIGGIELLILTT